MITESGDKLFRDLAPSQNAADKNEIYTTAIDYALASPRIKNIAFTGPYSSGKSSIIQTYEEMHKKAGSKFLYISLATFKDDCCQRNNTTSKLQNEDQQNSPEEPNPEQIEQQLIEQSILQQMLYGAESTKLPYSRFRRIIKPKKPHIKAVCLVIWGFLLFLLISNSAKILVSSSIKEWWIWAAMFIFAVISTVIIAEIYKILYRTPIRRVSLPNGEFETAEVSECSILNRNIDEIIYFFQEVNYNVVVIEDLDRFGSIEIFIKLREINKLVNDNLKGCHPEDKSLRTVKFIYAIKDDMFLTKERTKFFDFIIPIIPVVDSSNSLDKIRERIDGQDYSAKFDIERNKQFLREVSFRLDDLRLIHNIFNEFNIYYMKIPIGNLDIVKLLAMIIYKNVYPKDFELLHTNQGALASISNMRKDLLADHRKALEKEIAVIKEQLKQTERERALSTRELIDSYIGRIISYSNSSVNGIIINNDIVGFNSNISLERFLGLLKEEKIELSSELSSRRVKTGKKFSDIEEEVNPGISFNERVKAIENRSVKEQMQLRGAVNDLEHQIMTLALKPLKELIAVNEDKFEEAMTEEVQEDKSIFSYLVRNGFLDENYHLYISNFYEGRLSLQDRDFIIAASSHGEPLPSEFPIDTPQEIIQNIGIELFDSIYVLNVRLVDYLVETNTDQTTRMLEYIANNYNKSESFLQSYFVNSKHVDLFIQKLFSNHPNLICKVYESSLSAEIIAYILRFFESKIIKDSLNIDSIITLYLNDNGEKIFVAQSVLPNNYEILVDLNVKFVDLSKLDSNPELLIFCYKNNLYKICSSNILFLLERFADRLKYPATNIRKANYTAIISSQEDFIKKYIKENIELYIDDVHLRLPENCEEKEDAIIDLLSNSSIEVEVKKRILNIQNHVFKEIASIPEVLWGFALSEKAVELNWENISTYNDLETRDPELLTGVLNDEENVEEILKNDIKQAKLEREKKEKVFKFIAENSILHNNLYEKYMREMKCQCYSFPEVSIEKMMILVDTGCVNLNSDTFSSSVESNELRALLIEKNLNEYFSSKDDYPLTDEIRVILIDSMIPVKAKYIIISDMSVSFVTSNSLVGKKIADILVKVNDEIFDIDKQVIYSAIKNASDCETAVLLLIRMIPKLDEDTCMEILSAMKAPYNDIANYGKRPKLEFTEYNFTLVQSLQIKKWISKNKQEKDGIRIITFNTPQH